MADVSLSIQVESQLNSARDSLRRLDEDIRLLSGRRGDEPGARREVVQSSSWGGGNVGQKRRSTFGRLDGDDRKRPRLVGEVEAKPAVQSSVSMPLKDVKSRDAAITEMKESEGRELAGRNKRMFGTLLLGTLRKFKKEEEKQTFIEQERKLKEIESRLEDSKRKEQLEMEKERDKLMEKRRRQESDVRRLQRKRALITATENQISLMKRLQNFIQTTTKPHIFFIPAKHTIRTIELQKKSQKRLDEMMNCKREEMEKELKEMEEETTKWPEEEEEGEEGQGQCGVNQAVIEPSKPKDIQEELKELSAGYAEELNFEDDEQQR